MGKRLLRPVVRSGGLGIGKVEELALNAQETRLYGSIDGTRTGEELLKSGDAAVTLRLLYLLTEVGPLSFGEVVEEDEITDPELQPVKVPVETEKLPGNAERAPEKKPHRELPKSAREVGREPPRAKRGEVPKVAKAAPPVMHSAPPVLKGAHPASTPTAVKAMAPPPVKITRPPPTWAAGPTGESPQAAEKRLSGLFEH